MKKYEWFDDIGRMYLEFNQSQVDKCSHQGKCYNDCKAVAEQIRDQLSVYTLDEKIVILSETGAWEENELQNENETNLKIVWLACCDIKEDPEIYDLSIDPKP